MSLFIVGLGEMLTEPRGMWDPLSEDATRGGGRNHIELSHLGMRPECFVYWPFPSLAGLWGCS